MKEALKDENRKHFDAELVKIVSDHILTTRPEKNAVNNVKKAIIRLVKKRTNSGA